MIKSSILVLVLLAAFTTQTTTFASLAKSRDQIRQMAKIFLSKSMSRATMYQWEDMTLKDSIADPELSQILNDFFTCVSKSTSETEKDACINIMSESLVRPLTSQESQLIEEGLSSMSPPAIQAIEDACKSNCTGSVPDTTSQAYTTCVQDCTQIQKQQFLLPTEDLVLAQCEGAYPDDLSGLQDRLKCMQKATYEECMKYAENTTMGPQLQAYTCEDTNCTQTTYTEWKKSICLDVYVAQAQPILNIEEKVATIAEQSETEGETQDLKQEAAENKISSYCEFEFGLHTPDYDKCMEEHLAEYQVAQEKITEGCQSKTKGGEGNYAFEYCVNEKERLYCRQQCFMDELCTIEACHQNCDTVAALEKKNIDLLLELYESRQNPTSEETEAAPAQCPVVEQPVGTSPPGTFRRDYTMAAKLNGRKINTPFWARIQNLSIYTYTNLSLVTNDTTQLETLQGYYKTFQGFAHLAMKEANTTYSSVDEQLDAAQRIITYSSNMISSWFKYEAETLRVFEELGQTLKISSVERTDPAFKQYNYVSNTLIRNQIMSRTYMLMGTVEWMNQLISSIFIYGMESKSFFSGLTATQKKAMATAKLLFRGLFETRQLYILVQGARLYQYTLLYPKNAENYRRQFDSTNKRSQSHVVERIAQNNLLLIKNFEQMVWNDVKVKNEFLSDQMTLQNLYRSSMIVEDFAAIEIKSQYGFTFYESYESIKKPDPFPIFEPTTFLKYSQVRWAYIAGNPGFSTNGYFNMTDVEKVKGLLEKLTPGITEEEIIQFSTTNSDVFKVETDLRSLILDYQLSIDFENDMEASLTQMDNIIPWLKRYTEKLHLSAAFIFEKGGKALLNQTKGDTTMAALSPVVKKYYTVMEIYRSNLLAGPIVQDYRTFFKSIQQAFESLVKIIAYRSADLPPTEKEIEFVRRYLRWNTVFIIIQKFWNVFNRNKYSLGSGREPMSGLQEFFKQESKTASKLLPVLTKIKENKPGYVSPGTTVIPIPVPDSLIQVETSMQADFDVVAENLATYNLTQNGIDTGYLWNGLGDEWSDFLI